MNKQLRVVFMGNPDFAVPSLIEISKNHKVELVICSPDRPAGRGRKLRAPDIKIAAQNLNLNIFQPDSPNSLESIEKIKQVAPDLIVIVAFKILKKEVIDIPTIGAINLHASLLPKYRGAAPIQWAVANGDNLTGCTIFFLNEGIDEGSVLDKIEIPIGDSETAEELWDKMKIKGASFLVNSLDKIASGNYKLYNQDDSLATKAPKLKKEIGKIDFSMPAKQIFNLFRGFTPYPGIYAFLNEKKMQFTKIQYSTEFIQDKPGAIIEVSKNEIKIACKESCIIITEIKPANKKNMPISAFLNGSTISVGDCFE